VLQEQEAEEVQLLLKVLLLEQEVLVVVEQVEVHLVHLVLQILVVGVVDLIQELLVQGVKELLY
jgi:hypothetical protein